MIIKGTIVDTHFDDDAPYFSLLRGSDQCRCHVEQSYHNRIMNLQATGKQIELEVRISRADFWVDQILEAAS